MKPVCTFAILGVLAVSLAFTSCTATQQGAAGGAAIGAGAGALIGNQSGNAGEGALIGAAVGGLSGALVGDATDKNKHNIQHSHGPNFSHSHPGGGQPHTHNSYSY